MAVTSGLPHFPFDSHGYRPVMGLSPLASEQWIEVDQLAAEQLRLRADLLASQRDAVLLFSPAAEDACLELNRVLRRHLLEHLPSHAVGDLRRLRVVPTGMLLDEPANGIEALEQLAHLAQEDFCVLSGDGRPVLMAGLVCFPSHWMPAEKLGQTSDEIHTAVPGFAEKLAAPTNAVLQKLLPNRPVWRINWTIHDSDTLHCPVPNSPRPDLDVDNVLQSTWLRLERQTLRRLPQTGAITFTIRTYQQRIADVIRDATRREHLAVTLTSLPPETVAYKGLQTTLPLLTDALANWWNAR